MKKEDLFDGFIALDDELLERSEKGERTVTRSNSRSEKAEYTMTRRNSRNEKVECTMTRRNSRSEKGERTMTKRKSMSKIIKLGSLAACFMIALGIVVFWLNDKRNPEPENNVVAESNDHVPSDISNIEEEPEKYVGIELLLASNEGIQEQALLFKSVEIEGYSAIYYKVEAVDSSILNESIGSEVEGTHNWYAVSGHEDLNYLIFRSNNEYSLWKFNFFQSKNYPYKDVLQLVYNINSSEDIKEIMVAPANMDNSDEGKAIQNAIGTSVITDVKEIETIYGVLSGLTCYGNNQWEMIGLGDDSTSAMQEKVKVGRYLTLVTSQGMEIDTLKYTGISGMFYEYGGIAYSALSKEEKSMIEKILNIMSEDQAEF